MKMTVLSMVASLIKISGQASIEIRLSLQEVRIFHLRVENRVSLSHPVSRRQICCKLRAGGTLYIQRDLLSSLPYLRSAIAATLPASTAFGDHIPSVSFNGPSRPGRPPVSKNIWRILAAASGRTRSLANL